MKCSNAKNLNLAAAVGEPCGKVGCVSVIFCPPGTFQKHKQEKPELYVGKTQVSGEAACCAGVSLCVNCGEVSSLWLGLVLFCQAKLEPYRSLIASSVSFFAQD